MYHIFSALPSLRRFKNRLWCAWSACKGARVRFIVFLELGDILHVWHTCLTTIHSLSVHAFLQISFISLSHPFQCRLLSTGVTVNKVLTTRQHCLGKLSSNLLEMNYKRVVYHPLRGRPATHGRYITRRALIEFQIIKDPLHKNHICLSSFVA